MAVMLPGFNELKINIRTKHPVPMFLIENAVKEMFDFDDEIIVYSPQTKNVWAYDSNGDALPLNPVYERFEVLKSMNTIIRYMNDEMAYERWIYLIPDGADDDELWGIAEDDDEIFEKAVMLFRKLICNNDLADGGLYVGEKVYELRKDSELK